MQAVLADLSSGTFLPWQVICLRLGLATMLGGILGFEREMTAHSAGLRTHMLVSLAAATFAVLTIEIVSMPMFQTEHVRADPMRLVEAITAGVAFLAAGFIVFRGGSVRGLTTGAGMWLAGAIGLAAGLGLWLVAGLSCLLGTLVLALMRRLEVRFKPRRRPRERTADDSSSTPD